MMPANQITYKIEINEEQRSLFIQALQSLIAPESPFMKREDTEENMAEYEEVELLLGMLEDEETLNQCRKEDLINGFCW